MCTVTGHGLKDVETALSTGGPQTVTVAPTVEAAAEALGMG